MDEIERALQNGELSYDQARRMRQEAEAKMAEIARGHLGSIERLISELKGGNAGTEPRLLNRAIDFAQTARWIDDGVGNFCRRCVEVGAVESAAFGLIPDGWWLTLTQFCGTTGSGKEGFNADLLSVRGTPPGPLDPTKVWGISETAALAVAVACIKAHTEPTHD